MGDKDMQRLKQSRAASFAVVFLVYVICGAVGVLCYNALSLSFWLSLLISDVAATLVAFAFSLIFSNASVYDPYWSVQPPVIIIAFALGRELSALGILYIAVVSFWAIRLTANWAYTFKGLNFQDWRYTMLKEKTGAFYPLINLVGIHMVPTLVVYACTLPCVYAITEGVRLNAGAAVFLTVSLLSAVMQGIADIQMHTFRKKRCGGFIRIGLWKHSRHPNYLGEILMWWGVALALVCASPSAWYYSFGALLNTMLFLFVSIPMADKRQSRKEGYALYKAETRALLPIKKFRKA